ncbi:hypothetical protein BKA83DRAFT_4123720 [Pisolithus microcarpus]|nr:hypothetical protein BKA83DRAFT_4123720 [Pisolithus microcarpus]
MSVIVRCNYAHSTATILLIMFPAKVKCGERGDNEVGQKKNPEHVTAIFDMYMLVIGDDEHGVMPAVIGGVGILARIAKVSLITKLHRKKPGAKRPAVLEHRVCTVGDDERRHELIVTGDIGTELGGASSSVIRMVTRDVDTMQILYNMVALSYSTSVSEYGEKNPTLNGLAVLEIRVHAVGDDEHGRELVVTGAVGTRAKQRQ